MLTFVIAIGFVCFQISAAQRAITAVASGIVFSLVAWEIAVHWKSLPFKGDDNLFSMKDVVARIKSWRMQPSIMG